MNPNIVTDKHTIYVKCRGFTSETAKDAINGMMRSEEMSRVLGCDKCFYKYVHVCTRDGKSQDHGYLYVQLPKVYYAILGRNMDGSERSVFVEDETFVPKSTMNWNQVPDFDNPVQINWEHESESSIPPMILVHLPPLISPVKTMNRETNEIIQMEFVSAFVEKVKITNILRAYDIPIFITESMICNLFKVYSSDTKSYPKVKITDKMDKRNAIVEFKPGSIDANFAAYMSYSVGFTNPTNNNIENVSFRINKTI
jgi:hypothetical protein